MKFKAVVMLLACIAVSAPAQHTFLPFPVTIGGQEAKMKSKDAIFSVLEKEVAADAEVVLKIEPGMVIINAFPSDDKGNPVAGASPAIIMIQNGTKVKLNQTMDKKPLKSGNHIANIVAGGKTARVLFKVK